MRRIQRLLGCVRHGIGYAECVLEHVRQLPEAKLDGMLRNRPILVVAPHPDDESLGCGGLIAQAASLSVVVHILIVTDGSASHPETIAPAALRDIRRRETLAAAAVLGVPSAQVHFWDVKDGSAPHSGRAAAALVQRLADLVRRVGAYTVFATWEIDSHPDHVAIQRYSARAAAKTDVALFTYPVWAWMLPPRTVLPDARLYGFSLAIEAKLDEKRRAVLQHSSQIEQPDRPRGFGLSDAQLAAMITPFEYFIVANKRARQRIEPYSSKTLFSKADKEHLRVSVHL